MPITTYTLPYTYRYVYSVLPPTLQHFPIFFWYSWWIIGRFSGGCGVVGRWRWGKWKWVQQILSVDYTNKSAREIVQMLQPKTKVMKPRVWGHSIVSLCDTCLWSHCMSWFHDNMTIVWRRTRSFVLITPKHLYIFPRTSVGTEIKSVCKQNGIQMVPIRSPPLNSLDTPGCIKRSVRQYSHS